MVTVLLGGLVVIAVAFAAAMWRARARAGTRGISLEGIGLGAVTNFFDTLGIGSFAPTTAYVKLRRMVPDSFIPAVLNAGHALPTVTQALVFIALVDVSTKLLVGCIVAAVVGALAGAPLVVRMPLKLLQAIVGVALLVAAALFALGNLELLPSGGTARDLSGGLFVAAVAVHFVLGALMTAGIGLYGPSLAFLSLLGLDPKAVFPIMMGACAFLMPASGFKFVASDRIDHRVVAGLALGGIPAVLLAAYVVKELPLTTLRWLVVAVVLYTAVVMLRAATRREPAAATA
jgi:uncharacterized membrane protein YfcA